jgi:hypothetical protein
MKYQSLTQGVRNVGIKAVTPDAAAGDNQMGPVVRVSLGTKFPIPDKVIYAPLKVVFYL